jgi:hypothetical protein
MTLAITLSTIVRCLLCLHPFDRSPAWWGAYLRSHINFRIASAAGCEPVLPRQLSPIIQPIACCPAPASFAAPKGRKEEPVASAVGAEGRRIIPLVDGDTTYVTDDTDADDLASATANGAGRRVPKDPSTVTGGAATH